MSIERDEEREIPVGRLPGGLGALSRQLLRKLEEAGVQGGVPEELLPDTDPDDVARAVARLREQGAAVVRSRGRWAAARFGGEQSGEIEMLEDGDALVRPLEGAPPGRRPPAGWYVDRRRLQGARDGDRVRVRALEGRTRRVRGQRLPEARVEEILVRRHTTVVGTLEIDGEDRRWLQPFDHRLDLDVLVTGGEDLLEEEWVVVRLLDEGGGSGDEPVHGEVIEVLGESATPGVDVLVALRHHGIPDRFPDSVLDVAERLPEDPGAQDRSGREDLTGTVTVTIDGESARDFDDAVSLERLERGLFRLGVHIADVAHYVPEGEVLDREAYRRGTSSYFPDRAVPMLPERLSNGLCSLRPGVPRLTQTVFVDIDADGRVVQRRFAETVIESRRRLTYEEVRRVLEEPSAGDEDEYGPVLPLLRNLKELMEILLAARMERGSVDFDLPAGDVTLDTDGYVVGITPQRRHVAHRIIEECMIAANEAVAKELLDRRVAALFRVHDAPDVAKLEELREVLRTFGLGLKGQLSELHPGELQKVLRRVEGRPEEDFVTTLVLRTMQRALYSPECRGHYALASREYCHFTSPIRRYPDLVAHRRLKALIRGGETRAQSRARETALPDRLEAMAEHCSDTERRAERAERDVLQWKKVRFLADRIGETFNGRITGVQPFGLFVQLDELYVDGLVPIRTLHDDYYLFEDEEHRLVGEKHGRVFRLADPVEVVLTSVDERHRGLNLKIADLAELRPFRRGPKRRGGRRRRRAS